MKYTAAQASKLIRKLNADHASLLKEEAAGATFLVASGENPDELRPDYVYEDVQHRLADLEGKICAAKHALNVFNATHTVDGTEMTVDAVLVYLPLLTCRVQKLSEMKTRLPKTREPANYRNIIDYRVANYDRTAVAADYEKAFAELSALQVALDTVNNRDTLDLPF